MGKVFALMTGAEITPEAVSSESQYIEQVRSTVIKDIEMTEAFDTSAEADKVTALRLARIFSQLRHS